MSYVVDDKSCITISDKNSIAKLAVGEVIVRGGYHEGDVILDPLERGYGLTLGAAFRRIMLSSLSGPAVYGVEIDGVSHEFTSISGVREDVTDIVLNISKLCVRLSSVDKKCLYLKAKGPCEIRANMIESDGECTVLNSDLYICTLDSNTNFKMKIYIDSGKGYASTVGCEREETGLFTNSIGFIRVNALYSPVNKVSFTVENSRVGQVIGYDKLIMSVKTNGSLSPKEAVALAAKILQRQLLPLVDCNDVELTKVKDSKKLPFDPILLSKVSDLEFCTRAQNYLEKEGIVYIGDLVQKKEYDMLRAPSFGKRTLEDIKDKLAEKGLSLGMSIPNWSPSDDIKKFVEKYSDLSSNYNVDTKKHVDR
ncbi:DNA-directed RNA polymerase subunit alpha [Candidatus Mesenet endosymbiont of Agriotes lineatus]|uniref:DNA-directed RNA polymerase subunit alpha n=1 Tax=Candidatus Mesenet endosymbiont of Agriotes lineatus TaxID=3077948 RepID=UPI0030D53E66